MLTDQEITPEIERTRAPRWQTLLADLILVFILLLGGYLRFTGTAWDDLSFMHPDERFLVMVTSSLQPLENLGDYFDTAVSKLNPHNTGYTFYVYGTYPIILTRYLLDWLGTTPGWNEIVAVGRPLSGLFDLLTLVLVYWIGRRVYDRRVGLLAAAFLAVAVLPVQLSHFYKEDTFLNFFMLLAVYFAAQIMTSADSAVPEDASALRWQDSIFRQGWLPFIGFGLALGMAVASKLNAAPVALVLPAAVGLRLVKAWQGLGRAQQNRALAWGAGLVILAALVSLATFRVAQPYAFSGPGLLGIKPNQAWVDDIVEQRNQAAGDLDFPPSLQWARRPAWFALQNLVVWGFGLPLGLLVMAGFLWMGYRMLRGEWQKHILLWGWAAIYLAWQSAQFNPTMRYLLPAYPLLAIFAAWSVFYAWDAAVVKKGKLLWRAGAAVTAGAVLLASLAYAYAFTQIHTESFTRAEASRWIYQNIPGPINLQIQTEQGVLNQPLSLPYDLRLRPEQPYLTVFSPRKAGVMSEILLPRVIDRESSPGAVGFLLTLSTEPQDQNLLSASQAIVDFNIPAAEREGTPAFLMDPKIPLQAGQLYYLNLRLLSGYEPIQLGGALLLELETDSGVVQQEITMADVLAQSEIAYSAPFSPVTTGTLGRVLLAAEPHLEAAPESKTLRLALSGSPDGSQPLASGSVSSAFKDQRYLESGGYRVRLDQPVELAEGQTYYLTLSVEGAGGALAVEGVPVANEGDWDDGLPLRLDGYDGFGGIYPQELNFNMYWDDNRDKLERFQRILDTTEYIFISSSRQWGTLPRLPERFPMTTAYYRALLGCPEERTIEWCYNVAEPGMFNGNLGFELVQVFQSNPTIGALEINTQFAEEAFTVYDHPKVFIFQKTEAYTPELAAAVLNSADLESIIRVTPKKAASRPMNLMLPEGRLSEQRSGGTWSELFDTQGLLNRWQPLGVVVWYLLIFALGLAAYPLVRRALPGLKDGGYPFTRLVGMLLLAYGAWLVGSAGIQVNQLSILGVLAALLAVSALVGYHDREEIKAELRERQALLVLVEILALVSFLLILAIRFGNPDLWHPWKGGEKPMDFSYFNAVLKSSTFPPYDPWYAGGYINYYYYGFVIVGMPVKLLGLNPAIAYNLILPTLYSLLFVGVFSIGWNLLGGGRPTIESSEGGEKRKLLPELSQMLRTKPVWSGLAAALGLALLGNQGTVRMLWRGYQMIATPENIDEMNIFTRWIQAATGFIRALSGANLPYSLGDWYWNPSRAIPALGDVEPITEFPFFTVLYGDLHAHLIALPVTALALGWVVSLIRGGLKGKNLASSLGVIAFGGLVIGTLRPTNTWDLPTYLALGSLALGYAVLRDHADQNGGIWQFLRNTFGIRSRYAAAGLAVGLLVGLTFLFYQPFAYWYGLGYSEVMVWEGARTPLWSYLLHWGLFLFLIVSWMAAETIEWMAATPVSALKKLEPYKEIIWGAVAVLAGAMLLLGVKLPEMQGLPVGRGVQAAWLALPLAAWAGVLLLRPGLADSKRLVLFMVGTGLVLTLVVEVIVLAGDIGRMNTVFKFYLQVWTLFAISAAAAFGWLLSRVGSWHRRLRNGWRVIFALLVAGAALYPLMAGTAKVKDRMAADAPSSLDGMSYMPYARFYDQGLDMDLSQDYAAIRWMQENVQGSPVIVEGNTPEYRWGSRYTIYTGLPGVVGWNWHQRQQRGGIVPADWVTNRIGEVANFYITSDQDEARAFLEKYDVEYIVVGQLESVYYPGDGLAKFPQWVGVLWEPVFQVQDTTIYRVLD